MESDNESNCSCNSNCNCEYEIEDSDKTNIEDETTMLNKIDDKITLKFIKNGKAARTHIIGLNYFLDDHHKIAKEIQKKLSTGYLYIKETNEHCYNGEHKLKLERILINDYKISKSKIFIY